MKFKLPSLRKEYNEELHYVVQHVLIMIDMAVKLLGGELTVTSIMREKGEKPSFHPLGQAADIRTKDMKRNCLTAVISVLAVVGHYNKKIQFEHEDIGKDNDHIHIEYDTKPDTMPV